MVRSSVCICLLLPLCVVSAARAQASGTKNASSEVERTKSLWDPQVMMKQACEGISRHYKLDGAQREFTCKLLTERVTNFLQKHDQEFWPLLMELTELQLAGRQPDQDTAKRISDRGYHIFMDARTEILRSQTDFREILNDDQKKIHDRDLKGLDIQFRAIDKRFQNWRQGNVKGRSPLKNVRIAGGEKILPDSVEEIGGSNSPSESQWKQYVKRFVLQYRLDETQQNAATAILEDLEKQAVRYRKSHRKDLVDADLYVRETLLARPFDKEAHQQAKRIKALLNKPFGDWFSELKARLDQIPTEKQKNEAYAKFPHLKPRGAKPAAETAATSRSTHSGPKPKDAKGDKKPVATPEPKDPGGSKTTDPKPPGSASDKKS